LLLLLIIASNKNFEVKIGKLIFCRTLAASKLRSGDGESCSSSSTISYSEEEDGDADDEESEETSISDELTQVCAFHMLGEGKRFQSRHYIISLKL